MGQFDGILTPAGGGRKKITNALGMSKVVEQTMVDANTGEQISDANAVDRVNGGDTAASLPVGALKEGRAKQRKITRAASRREAIRTQGQRMTQGLKSTTMRLDTKTGEAYDTETHLSSTEPKVQKPVIQVPSGTTTPAGGTPPAPANWEAQTDAEFDREIFDENGNVKGPYADPNSPHSTTMKLHGEGSGPKGGVGRNEPFVLEARHPRRAEVPKSKQFLGMPGRQDMFTSFKEVHPGSYDPRTRTHAPIPSGAGTPVSDEAFSMTPEKTAAEKIRVGRERAKRKQDIDSNKTLEANIADKRANTPRVAKAAVEKDNSRVIPEAALSTHGTMVLPETEEEQKRKQAAESRIPAVNTRPLDLNQIPSGAPAPRGQERTQVQTGKTAEFAGMLEENGASFAPRIHTPEVVTTARGLAANEGIKYSSDQELHASPHMTKAYVLHKTGTVNDPVGQNRLDAYLGKRPAEAARRLKELYDAYQEHDRHAETIKQQASSSDFFQTKAGKLVSMAETAHPEHPTMAPERSATPFTGYAPAVEEGQEPTPYVNVHRGWTSSTMKHPETKQDVNVWSHSAGAPKEAMHKSEILGEMVRSGRGLHDVLRGVKRGKNVDLETTSVTAAPSTPTFPKKGTRKAHAAITQNLIVSVSNVNDKPGTAPVVRGLTPAEAAVSKAAVKDDSKFMVPTVPKSKQWTEVEPADGTK